MGNLLMMFLLAYGWTEGGGTRLIMSKKRSGSGGRMGESIKKYGNWFV